MKIKLIRTGGIIPLKKTAETEVQWTVKELDELMGKISRDNKKAGNAKDNTGYHLSYNNNTIPVDLDKVPAAFKQTFEALIENLQPEKF